MSTEDEKAIARAISLEKGAQGVETGVGVVVWLVVFVASIAAGELIGWGHWGVLWGFLVASVVTGYLTHGIKDRLLS